MGKFDGMLLVSDLDGTFLDEKVQLHPKNMEAIAYFRREGGKFTVATGRNVKSSARYIQKLYPDCPVIVLNGSAIFDWDKQELLWTVPLDDKIAQFAQTICREFPESAVALVNETDCIFINDTQAGREFRAIEKLPYLIAPPKDIPKPWIKMITCQSAEQTAAMRAYYANSVYNERYKLIRSGENYFEAIHKNSNKGNALLELSRRTGIPLHKIYAIGDNENDCALLKTAGIGAATANATHDAKQNAD